MRQGILDEDGQVRCPKCRSVSFRTKRSFKAKAGIGIAGVATLGVGGAAGALAAPKRIKCLACGELFKARAQPAPRPAPSLSSRPAPKPRPERTPVAPRERKPLLQLPPPSTDPGEPRGTLILKRAAGRNSHVETIRVVRPDLSEDDAKKLLRDTRWGVQPLLVDQPKSYLAALVTSLKAAGLSCEVVDDGGSVLRLAMADRAGEGGPSGPIGTLLVRRMLATGSMIDAVAAMRPDLTRDEAKKFIRSLGRERVPLLVDRPMAEILAAEKVLRGLGVRPEIVQGRRD